MRANSVYPALLIVAFFAVPGCGDTGAQRATPAAHASHGGSEKPHPTDTGEDENARHADTKQPQSVGAHGVDHDPHGETAHAQSVHAEHTGEGSGGQVHLTAEQRARLDIEIAEAESGRAAATITAPATVRFDSDRIARIGPRLSAKVVEVSADLGVRVQAGDTVAILDSVELGQAKAGYLTAAARYRTRLAAYRRNQKLARDKIISQAALLESRAAYSQARAEREAARSELALYGMSETAIAAVSAGRETSLSRYPLTAPITGVVQDRDLVPGQSLGANETPIQIVDNSRMWVMIEAFEADLARLHTGLPVRLTVRPLPGRSFTGTVDWISQALDEKSRTVGVRASVANPDGALRAGMFGSVEITSESDQPYALVPLDAIQTIDGNDAVFVPAEEDNAFRVVPVIVGEEGGGRIEIVSGLQAGAPVVVAGAFALNSALTAGSRSAAHSH